ncbi:MAG: branched-chain amino acid ABC transporter permease [Dethiobacteria bacterium]|nr:branched-chain amino acid ABC transporter permease [Bacillota bacterium]
MDAILQSIISGILVGGIYALISIGLTLIFGIVRIVNFAHGEFLMLGMYFTYFVFTYLGIDPYLAILLVVPLMFFLGAITHKLVIKPVLRGTSMQHILVTVGLMFFFQNIALLLWTADYRTVRTDLSSQVLRFGNINIGMPRLLAFLVAIAVTIGIYLFLKHTYLGKAIRAVSMDRQGAMLMGINIDFIYTFAFALGIALVGLAAAMMSPIYYVFPTVGPMFEVVAFVVVVLGGLGNFTGALLGGLLIGLVESFSGFFIAPALKEAIYFAIFIVVLAIKPSGLFGMGAGFEEVGLK